MAVKNLKVPVIVDPVGVAEAADILGPGWDKRKVSTYTRRGVFPAPVLRLACGPLWERKQIEEYQKDRIEESEEPKKKATKKESHFFSNWNKIINGDGPSE